MSTPRRLAVLATAMATVILAGCGGNPGAGPTSGNGASPGGSAAPADLTILIGTSGDAETQAVQKAVDAWAGSTGNKAKVVVASDLNQQLSQGFAGGDPPDLFYMSWDQFSTYAKHRYLEPYAADLKNAGDYYQGLIDTFTHDGTFYCAPKDFSTLGLIVNTDLWKKAGLTDADVPKDWAGLESAAKKLTKGSVTGLSFGLEYARVGVFMNQAGGQLVGPDGATADTPENLAGLQEVEKLHSEGVLKFPAELDAGWAGEALGAGKAAMVIEGPWIKGIASDFPDTKWAAYELPAGPGGKSTFTFTNCWGIPAGSDTRDAAVSLVEYLTTDEQQLAFADAFGVIPSTKSAAASYAKKYPDYASFVASADYAVAPVNFAGSAAVVSDFNAALEPLVSGKVDFKKVLSSMQGELQSAWEDAKG